MKKVLFYAMTGEKMCFSHILMNALDLLADGVESAIIFEGASVQLIPLFEEEKNLLYLKAKEAGLIAGFCLACSKVMEVREACLASGLPALSDMFGHAGFKAYLVDGYEIVSM